MFGKRTVTKTRKERDSDESLMIKRTETIARSVNSMDEDKRRESEKIFIARKRYNRNNDDNLVETLKNHKTGVRMTTAEEVFKDSLEYNIGVLGKNEETSDEGKKIRKDKAETVAALEQYETKKTEEKEEPKAPIKKNDIREIRTLRQLARVNLDLDSPRMKQAMDVAGVSPEDLDKK